MNVIPETRRVQ